MKNIINRLEQKKQKLDTFRPLDQALLQSLDQWFTVELAYNSNAIEGNTLTRREVSILMQLKKHKKLMTYQILIILFSMRLIKVLINIFRHLSKQ